LARFAHFGQRGQIGQRPGQLLEQLFQLALARIRRRPLLGDVQRGIFVFQLFDLGVAFLEIQFQAGDRCPQFQHLLVCCRRRRCRASRDIAGEQSRQQACKVSGFRIAHQELP
jgi:hypothetical protein